MRNERADHPPNRPRKGNTGATGDEGAPHENTEIHSSTEKPPSSAPQLSSSGGAPVRLDRSLAKSDDDLPVQGVFGSKSTKPGVVKSAQLKPIYNGVDSLPARENSDTRPRAFLFI
jgi:hypothetical protein